MIEITSCVCFDRQDIVQNWYNPILVSKNCYFCSSLRKSKGEHKNEKPNQNPKSRTKKIEPIEKLIGAVLYFRKTEYFMWFLFTYKKPDRKTPYPTFINIYNFLK